MLQVALLALLAVAPDPTSAVGRGVAPASRAGHLLAAKRATPERRPASPDAPPAQASRGDKLVGEWPARPSGKTVALEEEPTLDEALGKIAEAAGWNLVANTGAAGDRKLVVAVRGAPVEEALQAVLEGSPLVATRRGNTVTVAAAPALPPREQPVLSGFGGRPTGKRFTGDFAEVPVGQALGKVCDAAGLSVVFAPGVRGTVDGHFRNAPVEDVLRAILAQAGLAATREGSILTVARRDGAQPSAAAGGERGAPAQLDAEGDGGREPGREPQSQAGSSRAEKRSDKHRGHRLESDRVLQGDQIIGAGQRVGDLVVFRGNVRLQAGASAQQVTAIAGSVEVGPGANVDREVVAIGGDVHVAVGAHVGGDLVSVGGRIAVEPGASVEGDQTSVSVPGLAALLGGVVGTVAGGARHDTALWRLGSALAEFAVFFLLGLLVLLLVPRRLEGVTASLVNRPMKAVLTGVLATIALPLVVLLLVVTVFGIPFIAVVALGLAAAAVMGFTALALYVGRAVPFRFERGAPVLHLAIGTAALVALGQIPVLGCLALVAGWLFVFGVVLRTRFGQPPAAPPTVYGTTAPPPPPPPATGTEPRQA